MKKINWLIASSLTVIAPVVATISCGEAADTKNDQIAATTSEVYADHSTLHIDYAKPISNEDGSKILSFLNKNKAKSIILQILNSQYKNLNNKNQDMTIPQEGYDNLQNFNDDLQKLDESIVSVVVTPKVEDVAKTSVVTTTPKVDETIKTPVVEAPKIVGYPITDFQTGLDAINGFISDWKSEDKIPNWMDISSSQMVVVSTVSINRVGSMNLEFLDGNGDVFSDSFKLYNSVGLETFIITNKGDSWEISFKANNKFIQGGNIESPQKSVMIASAKVGATDNYYGVPADGKIYYCTRISTVHNVTTGNWRPLDLTKNSIAFPKA